MMADTASPQKAQHSAEAVHRRRPQLSRRAVLKGGLVVGGAALLGAGGYRYASNAAGRDYDVARSEGLLGRIEPAADPGSLPNIVVIMADDLGYGDLGCYGSQAIRTPNLDRLAAEGVRLTQFHSSAPLCSPSRAGMLTGRYGVRSHFGVSLFPTGSPMDIVYRIVGAYPNGVRGMPTDEVLLPELLRQRGYRTSLLGKWHLGDRSPHLPREQGFDEFYGAYNSNSAKPYAIYRNEEVEVAAPADQNVLTQNLTHEALGFVRRNAGRPFFLYYAQPFPHIPLHASDAFRGRSQGGLYGDTVEEIDWSVGQILDLLDELGLRESTLVIFTSDNGPWWEGSPGANRGRKNLPQQGGHLVPFIARWPGLIPAGTSSDALSMNIDVLPTCLAAAGLAPPDDRIIDGLDLLPVLRGETDRAHETVYYYKGARLMGVRSGDWKYLRRHMTDNGGYAGLSQGPFLFNLALDPNESYNQIQSQPGIAASLVEMLSEWEAAMESNVRGWL